MSINLLLRRRCLQLPQSGGGLPSGYKEKEYFFNSYGSSGVAFKTDFIPTKGCKVEMCFQGTATISSIAGQLFGCRTGYNSKVFAFKTSVTSATAENMTCTLGYKTERSVSSPNVMSSKNIFGVDNGKFYINDSIIGEYSDDFTPEYPLWFLGMNNAGSLLSGVTLGGRLFYAKIWDDNGILVRDYIPVERESDNQEGLFDLKTQTFLIGSR